MKHCSLFLSLFLASVTHADMIQTWRAIVVSNPIDPSLDADPAHAAPSIGTALTVSPGQSILFILSLNLTDTVVPPEAPFSTNAILRGIGAATSQLVGTAGANGTWSPVDGFGAGVYKSTGVSGIAIPGSGTTHTPDNIKGLGVLSNGLISGSGVLGSGISNTEGVDVLGILWTPNTYFNRTATFVGSPYGEPGDNAMWYRSSRTTATNGDWFPVTATGLSTFNITIVPAPASFSLLALTAIASRRRR